MQLVVHPYIKGAVVGWPWLAVRLSPSCSLAPHPQQDGGENRRNRNEELLGRDKVGEITYQLLLQAKQTHPRETDLLLIYIYT